MIDLRQTQQYARYMSSIGWEVERIAGVNYFIRKFPIIGSFIKVQRPGKVDYQYIDALVVKYRAFQIVIEPKNQSHKLQVISHKFKLSKNPFVPAKTIQIDLRKSKEILLKEMHHKTRYNIKLGKRSKVKVKRSKDINLFADFWQDCAIRQRNMFLSQKKEIIALYKAFGTNANLLLGFKGKELISGILMIKTQDLAYYMYAASSNKGKKLFAPTLNAWEAMLYAKKLGCKLFDFEGIYDERFPLNSWKGFTRFKKSFGGKEIEHPGAFTKLRIPV